MTDLGGWSALSTFNFGVAEVVRLRFEATDTEVSRLQLPTSDAPDKSPGREIGPQHVGY
jgi:hypothetical protein